MAMAFGGRGAVQAQDILSKLKTDLKDKKLPSQVRQSLLEQLKVLGRNPANASPIFAQEGVQTLAAYGLEAGPDAVSREAMRCLANAMLLNESTRQTFLDLGYSSKVAERLKSNDRDDEFLASRILFFLTYTGKLDIKTLINDHSLAQSVIENLSRHAELYSAPASSRPTDMMTKMSLEETLKLIPNLVYHYADAASKLSGAIKPITTILKATPIPTPLLQAPINFLINALMNLDLDPTPADPSITTSLFTPSNPTSLTNRLTTILSSALPSYPEADLDTTLSPLITLLRKLYPIAPAPVQQALQSTLLPANTSRSSPFGHGDDTPSTLLRLLSSPTLPLLRESIPALLYLLSNSDPSTLIQNIGYGHAAGFLATNNIPVPEGLGANTPSSSRTGPTPSINPVTGQYRDAEPEDDGPEMTDEEKEREAERLFVLFERLRATGVVDVQNPITRARDEGRFEEIE